MYVKFVITGILDSSYSGNYYSINGFKLYDKNNILITGLNSVNNLIYQDYDTRNLQSNTDLWFAPNTSGLVPYNSYAPKYQATIIIKINQNFIKKIDLYSYQNNGGGKYVNIYYSLDNINYAFSETVTFTAPSQIITTINSFSSFMSLLQDGNNICNTDGTLLSIIDILPYTIDKFNNYLIQDLLLINPTVINKIINDKFNIAILK